MAGLGRRDSQFGSGCFLEVTNNMREFSRMPGIRVENWV
jgi:predicted nucleic acid-binding protein